MDCKFGDISYVVKFYARTRTQYNAMYDKLCTLDKDKLHVCCVQTQRLNHVETEGFSFCGDKTEVIGTAVLNKEFYEMLVLACRNIEKKVDDNGNISSIENLVTIEQKESMLTNLMKIKKVHLSSI